MTLVLAPKLRHAERAVLAALADAPEGASPSEIASAVPERAERTLRAARASLVMRGFVAVREGVAHLTDEGRAAATEPAEWPRRTGRTAAANRPNGRGKPAERPPSAAPRAVFFSSQVVKTKETAAAAAALLSPAETGRMAAANRPNGRHVSSDTLELVARALALAVEALGAITSLLTGDRENDRTAAPPANETEGVSLPMTAGIVHRDLKPENTEEASPCPSPDLPRPRSTSARPAGTCAPATVSAAPSPTARTATASPTSSSRGASSTSSATPAATTRPASSSASASTASTAPGSAPVSPATGSPAAADLEAAIDERLVQHRAAVDAGEASPIASLPGWKHALRQRLTPGEVEDLLRARASRLEREAALAAAKADAASRAERQRASVEASRAAETEARARAAEVRRRIALLEDAAPAELAALRARAETLAASRPGARHGSPTWESRVTRELEALVLQPTPEGATAS